MTLLPHYDTGVSRSLACSNQSLIGQVGIKDLNIFFWSVCEQSILITGVKTGALSHKGQSCTQTKNSCLPDWFCPIHILNFYENAYLSKSSLFSLII